MENYYANTGNLVSRGGFGVTGYGINSISGGGQLTTATGGGSGWYGGTTSGSDGTWYSSTGGSSYISGYNGCNSISASSKASKIIHTGSAYHYSGKVFSNPTMIAGSSTQPSVGGGTQNGNLGAGAAKLTIVSRE